MHFMTGLLDRPVPLPRRQMTRLTGAQLEEGLGLQVLPRPLLNPHSEDKAEQRLLVEELRRKGTHQPAQFFGPSGLMVRPLVSPAAARVRACFECPSPHHHHLACLQIQLPDPLLPDSVRCTRDQLPGPQPTPETQFQPPTIRQARPPLIPRLPVPKSHPLSAFTCSELQSTRAELTRYRLDVRLGRLELAAHERMTREEWLALQLMQGVRQRKRRERSGLLHLLQRRLLAHEEALLAAREDLFQRSARLDALVRDRQAKTRAGRRGTGPAAPEAEREAQVEAARDEALVAFERLRVVEAEVAYTRQLVEGEFELLERSAEALKVLYAELQAEREMVGGCMSSLLAATALTCLPSFLPLQNPQSGCSSQLRRVALRVDQGTTLPGLTEDLWDLRRQLDVRLAVAEMEGLPGLQAAPKRLLEDSRGGFKLRRVESVCAAYKRQGPGGPRGRIRGRAGRPPSAAAGPSRRRRTGPSTCGH